MPSRMKPSGRGNCGSPRNTRLSTACWWSNPRPIDPQAVEQELQRQKQAGNCRTAFDDSFLRQSVERQFRLQRTHAEMVAGAAQPREVEAFYEANRENFQSAESFEAAHIVKHV